MRYIEKIAIEFFDKVAETKPLLDYIHSERNPTNRLDSPRHPNFSGMKSDNGGTTHRALIKQLFKEHFGLCCFCQEQVGSKYLIEHFLPQSLFKNEEVDYYNLLLSCQKKGQCSDYKKDFLIGKFITHPNCSTFFKYNWIGEILPACSYSLWEGDKDKGCKENLEKLNSLQLQAYTTIDTIGLNRQPLLSRRINKLNENNFKGLLARNKTNLDWLKGEQSKYKPNISTKVLPEFSNMFLYFINEQIEKRYGKEHI